MRLPRSIVPVLYDLELWVDLESCRFEGKLKTRLKIVDPTRFVCFNSSNLSIDSTTLCSGDEVFLTTSSFEDEIIKLECGVTLAPGEATLIITYHGYLNEKLDGFYKSLYQDANGTNKYMAVGTFEPADARRFLPCWDEPDFKARFKFKVHSSADRIILSNMPAINETVNGSVKTVEFAESVPMSTYIVTVVVGEFEYMEETSEDGVIVRVYARPGYLHKGKFALDLALKLLPFFSKLFGTSYPLPKLDLVAVPTFKAGALENFGCVVYLEEALLLQEDSSASIRQRVALDTAHELAHMWFGNLVTIDWWTHLWLNEGMATWMSYFAVDHVFPEWNVWISFHGIKEAGQQQDALVSSHPVEVPVGHANEASSAFDSISYCKGASLVHMLQSYLGPKDLQAALASYIRKFAFGNANSDDLWDTFDETTGKPIKELMHSWTKQKGYPAIKATLLESKCVQFEQYHFLANGSQGEGRWSVPVTFKVGKHDSESPKLEAFVLGNEPVKVSVEAGCWVHVNPGQVGFYSVQYDTELLKLLDISVLSPLDRLGVLKDMYSLCQAGKQPVNELLRWLSSYKSEMHPAVQRAMIDVSLGIAKAIGVAIPELAVKAKQYFCSILEPLARSIGWETVASENHLTSIVREEIFGALVALDHLETCLEAKKLFDRRNVHPSLMKAVYRSAMACPDNFSILVHIFRHSSNSEERHAILRSIAWTSDPSIVCKALDFSLSEEVKPQEVSYVFSGLKFGNWSTAWSWFKDNWAMVQQKLGEGLMMTRVVWALTNHIYSKEAAEDFKDFIKSQCSGAKLLKHIKEDVETAMLRAQFSGFVKLEGDKLTRTF